MQQQNKRFFYKPYLKYGQCLPLWSYFFQLGGILADRHSLNLDAFGTAFLGLNGKPGAVNNFFTDVANDIMRNYEVGGMAFADYVGTEFIRRLSLSDDVSSGMRAAVEQTQQFIEHIDQSEPLLRFFLEHGMEKLPTESAAELAWQYSESGAALGAIHPEVIREMFERTHVSVSKEKWKLAYNAGLDIGQEQEMMSYQKVEETENEMFMGYCQKCCPSVYSILKS